ncbi:MAG: adenylate kinase [Flavobacteriales bacterium]|nr:adenylate kinase [Flavobacteriales bacterium]|tara:strand:+ start:16351 stop:16938 length:588 start_codon:yes stop_codon:yes gene_type:complete
MTNIIIFGPPGSGKGTQAEFIINKLNLVHISTGDIFRKNISNKTKLGILATKYISKGQLVPDELTIDLLENELDKHPNSNGFIFDGFPRTIPQAEAFENLLIKKNMYLSMLLSLEVSEIELIARLLKRGSISGRSDDRNESIIKNRIKVYNEQTSILKKYYLKKSGDIFHYIDGEKSIENISYNIQNLINTHIKL